MPFLTPPPHPWYIQNTSSAACELCPHQHSKPRSHLHRTEQSPVVPQMLTHGPTTLTCCWSICGAACLVCCCGAAAVVGAGAGGCCILSCCNCWCFCAYTCCCMCWSRSCAKLICPGVLLMWFVPGGTCPTTTLGV